MKLKILPFFCEYMNKEWSGKCEYQHASSCRTRTPADHGVSPEKVIPQQ
jgi:hypothetical protein